MKTARRKNEGAELRTALSREGYFGKRLAGCRTLFFWSAALALLCTFISYPGIWYSDSYVRVSTGHAVLNAMAKTLTGHRMPLETGNPFTLIPSFFMALCLGLSGNIGLYTFVQAFAFFTAAFLLIRDLNVSGRRTQCFLFAVCPLIYGMSVYFEAGIGCVTGMIGLMLLFRRVGEEKSRGDRVFEFLLTAFCSLVTFGYRINALTILPPLVFYLLRMKAAGKLKSLAILALAVGMIFTKAIPWIFDVHSLSTATAGIVWEMLTAIQRMAPEDREKYQDYLDEIGGEGSTRGALATSTEGTAGNFMWGDHLGIVQMSAPGATVTALRKYVQLMAEKPAEWFGVKRDVILRSMGIQGELDYSEYNYNRWDAMEQYGMVDSIQRRAFYDSFVSVVSALDAWVLRPWVSFLVSLAFVTAEWFRKVPRRREFLLTLGMAAFYYLAYLLDTPAYDFRYFYPSLLLMTILDAAILWGWGKEMFIRMKKRKALQT